MMQFCVDSRFFPTAHTGPWHAPDYSPTSFAGYCQHLPDSAADGERNENQKNHRVLRVLLAWITSETEWLVYPTYPGMHINRTTYPNLRLHCKAQILMPASPDGMAWQP